MPLRNKNTTRDEQLANARIAARVCTLCGVGKLSHGLIVCLDCNPFPVPSKGPSEKYKALKNEIFERYGGRKCACCGETDRRMLSIDHINGGGSAHMRFIKSIGYKNIFEWLKVHNFPIGFIPLCHSCNIAKHRNGGVCPHQGLHALPDFDEEAFEVLKEIILNEAEDPAAVLHGFELRRISRAEIMKKQRHDEHMQVVYFSILKLLIGAMTVDRILDQIPKAHGVRVSEGEVLEILEELLEKKIIQDVSGIHGIYEYALVEEVRGDLLNKLNQKPKPLLKSSIVPSISKTCPYRKYEGKRGCIF